VRQSEPFVDIHCHLLPGVDDGATNWAETLAMARLAVAEGFSTIIATPHQLAGFVHVPAETAKCRAAEVSRFLAEQYVPLVVRPGAEIRICANIEERIAAGHTLSLGEHEQHVLIELPFELYLPCDELLATLRQRNIVPIMAHPERNHALRAAPKHVAHLVKSGWLMQITAGSLTGAFGPDVEAFAESLLAERLVHFVATDAHGPHVRPPLMRAAFERVVDLTGWETAVDLCCRNPAVVAEGGQLATTSLRPRKKIFSWWPSKAA